MIRLTRTATAAELPPDFRDPRRAKLLEALATSASKGAPDFDDSVWQSGKALLRAESHGKCAYCEADTSVVSHGDVEHYRPKATYWWLAYWFPNYVFACQVCNQLYKRDAFPVAGARAAAPKRRGRAVIPEPDDRIGTAATLKQLGREQPLLINPVLVDPAQLLGWEADELRGEVRAVPAAQGKVARDLAETSIRLYGLNREELTRLRFRTFRELRLFWRAQRVSDRRVAEEAQAQLAAMTAADAEFAGMCRFFLASWAQERGSRTSGDRARQVG